jgi:hypothetical protein
MLLAVLKTVSMSHVLDALAKNPSMTKMVALKDADLRTAAIQSLSEELHLRAEQLNKVVVVEAGTVNIDDNVVNGPITHTASAANDEDAEDAALLAELMQE